MRKPYITTEGTEKLKKFIFYIKNMSFIRFEGLKKSICITSFVANRLFQCPHYNLPYFSMIVMA